MVLLFLTNLGKISLQLKLIIDQSYTLILLFKDKLTIDRINLFNLPS